MDFVAGFVVGVIITAVLYYRFYHIKVVTDLKRIIEELKAK